jgi:hypothetical protein
VPRHLATPSGVALFLVVFLCAIAASAGNRASSASLLANGGFESGTTGWTVITDPTTSCPAFAGTSALSLAAGSGVAIARARQNLAAQPPGTLTFSGQLRHLSGPALPIVARVSAVVDGAEVATSVDRTPGDAYENFSVDLIVLGPAESAAVDIRFVADTAASICVDELTLEFVASPPTETPTPTATATEAPGAETPAVTQTIATTPGTTATATATPTASPPSTDNGLIFVNGGFEDGTSGWSKFGGELSTSANQRLSGAAGGRLTSSTASTKWAYQPVRIDPAKTYEFQGHVATDGEVEAYLRVSWYASSDASGSALSSIDSLSRVGAGSGFTHLTTGAIAPPQDAHSARLRVMLAPASESMASIFMDDFSFGITTAPPSTRTPVPEPAETGQAQVAGATATRVPPGSTTPPSVSPQAISTRQGSTPSASPSGTATSDSGQAAAVGTRSSGRSAFQGRNEETPASPVGNTDTPAWVYVALPAIAGLLGAGYWYSRRRQSP